MKRKFPDDMEDDEDCLLCWSLVPRLRCLPRLRRLPQREKYFARMQIEQMLFQAEFASTETARQAPKQPGTMSYPVIAAASVDYGFMPRGEPSSYLQFLHGEN